MVMMDLFRQTEYPIIVAHVNHNTRNGESDRDAKFVEQVASTYGFDFHLAKIEEPLQGNFQENARAFRYSFFESLSCDFIATAHHLDDNVESIFMNFLTGRSLNAIPKINGKIIRPLLEFTRADLEAYAQERELEYVEDSSNEETHYLRNFLRSEIIPQLKIKVPSLDSRVLNLSESQHKMEKCFEALAYQHIKLNETENGHLSYSKSIIDSSSSLLVYSRFREFGFNQQQIDDLKNGLDKVGMILSSPTHELLVDRKTIILRQVVKCPNPRIVLELKEVPCKKKFRGQTIEFNWKDRPNELASKNETYVPEDLLEQTIAIRTWQDGDSFKPYGMNLRTQKLKKFFTEMKLSSFEKETVPIFLSGKDIFWVGSYRSDERYKWNKASKRYLHIVLKTT